jgi:hypothetical protein
MDLQSVKLFETLHQCSEPAILIFLGIVKQVIAVNRNSLLQGLGTRPQMLTKKIKPWLNAGDRTPERTTWRHIATLANKTLAQIQPTITILLTTT